jgi:hypothetical protein
MQNKNHSLQNLLSANRQKKTKKKQVKRINLLTENRRYFVNKSIKIPAVFKSKMTDKGYISKIF